MAVSNDTEFVPFLIAGLLNAGIIHPHTGADRVVADLVDAYFAKQEAEYPDAPVVLVQGSGTERYPEGADWTNVPGEGLTYPEPVIVSDPVDQVDPEAPNAV